MKLTKLTLLALITLNPVFSLGAGNCDDYVNPKSLYAEEIARAKEFQEKYGEPEMLDQFMSARKIKPILDRLGVAYTELDQAIIINPIHKSGLNEFAFQMEKHRNIRIVFNMHPYSDRTAPSRDDYFQAYSDSYFTNLILSEQFINEVVDQKSWDVSEWIDQAKNYLLAYDQPKENLLSTSLVRDREDLNLEANTRLHLENMRILIYNLSHNNSDLYTFKEVQNEVIRFGNFMNEVQNFLSPILADLKINNSVTISDILPFLKDPISKHMDLNFIQTGANSYKALVTLEVNGARVNFYLEDNLSKEDLKAITGRISVHLKDLQRMIRSLNGLHQNIRIEDLSDLRAYNQKLISLTSKENKEFIY